MSLTGDLRRDNVSPRSSLKRVFSAFVQFSAEVLCWMLNGSRKIHRRWLSTIQVAVLCMRNRDIMVCSHRDSSEPRVETGFQFSASQTALIICVSAKVPCCWMLNESRKIHRGWFSTLHYTVTCMRLIDIMVCSRRDGQQPRVETNWWKRVFVQFSASECRVAWMLKGSWKIHRE